MNAQKLRRLAAIVTGSKFWRSLFNGSLRAKRVRPIAKLGREDQITAMSPASQLMYLFHP
jgi:hypothetical protein